jgi:hypothetical protein
MDTAGSGAGTNCNLIRHILPGLAIGISAQGAFFRRPSSAGRGISAAGACCPRRKPDHAWSGFLFDLLDISVSPAVAADGKKCGILNVNQRGSSIQFFQLAGRECCASGSFCSGPEGQSFSEQF